MRKTITIFWISLMLISLSTSRLHATHIAGLDLTLTCLGGNDYLIRGTLYRDCSGMIGPATATFVVQCTSNPIYNLNITGVPLKAGSGVEVTPICQGWITNCSGGTLYGIQEYVYEVQVTLPPCLHWRIGWSGTSTTLNGVCCRNPSNTVTNPTTQNAYIEVILDNQRAPCSSTPALQFAHIPVLNLCVGQTKCVSFGATDPNGDSLVYELVTPLTNGNQGTLTWIPPSSAQQPFPSLPPITLNPANGMLCMTPTMNIISPMALHIQKWRTINGTPTMIGLLIRDIQVTANTCSNSLPVLSGIDTTMTKGYDPNDTTYLMDACVGEALEFAIWGFDADQPNAQWGDLEKFEITWNNGIPQGLFQAFHNNTDSAYATFSWTPGAQDVGNNPKCFIAKISDGACPYNGQQSYTYCFIVRGTDISIGSDTLICQGESINLLATSQTPINTYHWFVDGYYTGHSQLSDTFTFHAASRPPGIYKIAVEGNRNQPQLCHATGEINIQVVLQPAPDLGPDRVIYGNNPVTLDAGPGAVYVWNTGWFTQQINVHTTGLYSVWVDGGQGTRCTGTDSVFIEFIIGIDEPGITDNLLVTPNPTSGDISFTLPENTGDQWAVQVFGTDGKEVLRKNLPSSIHNGKHTINLGHLTPGVYLLNISSGHRQYRSRVVVSSD